MNRGEKFTVGGLEAWGKEGERCNKSKYKAIQQMLTWEALESGSPKTRLYTGENTGPPTSVLITTSACLLHLSSQSVTLKTVGCATLQSSAPMSWELSAHLL